jgi:leucyl/phenylalanyl-tRNA--protein transferase
MFLLQPGSADLRFPPVHLASPEGLLAIGGDLRVERLLEAYRHGIFPWYSEGQPILWWSPDPRMVLFPDRLKVSRSLRKALRAGRYRVALDTRFRDVMQACAAPRPGQHGTWITPEMVDAYCRLHDLGLAHSVESYLGDELVGGLYGVALGTLFFGESMFARATDASKVAFVQLVQQLRRWGFTLIDCQVSTAHLASLGAEEIRRQVFLRHLDAALAGADRRGAWRFDSDLGIT